MKIQNMSVIFIIVMIPIMLVVSYYIGLQIDTIKMQTSYDQKLLAATKDAIDAFEINTTEWNSEYSLVSDSKRRDVLASINTFTTSIANNLGMSGATHQEMLNYIPAVAYTMYDGFYVYSSRKTNKLEENENGLTKLDNGEVKPTGETTMEYALNPYTAYTENIVNETKTIDIVVNYTMDNYMKIYGTVDDKYVTKQGFLSVIDDDKGISISDKVSPPINVGGYEIYKIDNIKFKGEEIKPEELTEQICLSDGTKQTYTYIYNKDNEKLYYDSDANEFFRLNDNGKQVYLQDTQNGYYNQYEYKKICIPVSNGTDWEVLKIYQGLNGDRKGKFYRAKVDITTGTNDFETEKVTEITNIDNYLVGIDDYSIQKNFSDINYCVDSYVFSKWVEKNLKDIKVTVEGQTDVKIFEINTNNNPDPESEDYGNSVLAIHKREVMSKKIEESLMQSLELSHGQNLNYEYRLPALSAQDWEQALSNVSIIAFMQGMPIGLKYYNNYQIATSTVNKEFVNPYEIYFSGIGDEYYHRRYCSSATGTNYIGYRAVDYKAKNRAITKGSDKGKVTYYYSHDKSEATDTSSEMGCYNCIVNKSAYKDTGTTIEKENYYEALTRERYLQKETVIISDIINGTIKKEASHNSVCIDDPNPTIEYEITVTNKSSIANVIDIIDTFNVDVYSFMDKDSIIVCEKNDPSKRYTPEINGKEIKFTVNVDTDPLNNTKKFIIKGTVIGNVGKYRNQVKMEIEGIVFEGNFQTVTVNRSVSIAGASSIMPPTNIVFVLDSSGSMLGSIREKFKYEMVDTAVENFVQKMIDANDYQSQVGAVRFSGFPILGAVAGIPLTWNPTWKDSRKQSL